MFCDFEDAVCWIALRVFTGDEDAYHWSWAMANEDIAFLRARVDLLVALQKGTVEAWGRFVGDDAKPARLMVPGEWAALSIVGYHNGVQEVFGAVPEGGPPGWDGLRFDVATLKRAFPAHEEKQANTVRGEDKCKRWFVDMMREGAPPTKNVKAYQEDAQRLFSVSGRAVQRAWASAIRESGNIKWKQAGRKS